MIKAYIVENDRLRPVEDLLSCREKVVWADLFEPTKDEEAMIEAWIGVDIPTREEMEEIEISSRLYTENEAFFMTATLASRTETDRPVMSPVTFVLAKGRLVTVRYSEPSAFKTFPMRAEKIDTGCTSGEMVLVGLLDAIIDRLADVLERASGEIIEISHDIFHPGAKNASKRDRNFRVLLRRIGSKESLISNLQDSLLTLRRVSSFFGQVNMPKGSEQELRARVKTLSRDVSSLADHATSLSQKIIFLLDATLGMIGIEQNGIIKIVSVAALVFLPPTLVASIYGMNFRVMPELEWLLGYPFALALMVISAVLPFWFFKRRGWL